jgi:hypothetical protein
MWRATFRKLTHYSLSRLPGSKALPGKADFHPRNKQPARLTGNGPVTTSPWMPILRLSALAAGVFLMIMMDRWPESLARPVLLCSLPLLLHTALLLPRARPFAAKHPYAIGWVYGVSAMAPAAWLLTWSVAPIMGGKVGMNLGFLLRHQFQGASEEARAAMALLCFAAALTIVLHWALGIRAYGWKTSVVGRPRRTVAMLLALPACSAIAIAGGCSLLQAPEAVLEAAAATVHAVLYSEVLAARGVVVFGFPVAICFALFRRQGCSSDFSPGTVRAGRSS